MKKAIICCIASTLILTGCSKAPTERMEDAANIKFDSVLEDTTEVEMSHSVSESATIPDKEESEPQTDSVTKKPIPDVLKDINIEVPADGRPPYDYKEFITGEADFNGLHLSYSTDRSVTASDVANMCNRHLFYYFGSAYKYSDLTDDIVRDMTQNEYMSVKGYKKHLADEVVEAKENSALDDIFNQALLHMSKTMSVTSFPIDVVEYEVNKYYESDYALANLMGWGEDYLVSVKDEEHDLIDQNVLEIVSNDITEEICAQYIIDYYGEKLTDEDYKNCLDSFIKEYGKRYTNQIVRFYGKSYIRLVAMERKAARLLVKDDNVILNS